MNGPLSQLDAITGGPFFGSFAMILSTDKGSFAALFASGGFVCQRPHFLSARCCPPRRFPAASGKAGRTHSTPPLYSAAIAPFICRVSVLAADSPRPVELRAFSAEKKRSDKRPAGASPGPRAERDHGNALCPAHKKEQHLLRCCSLSRASFQRGYLISHVFLIPCSSFPEKLI